MSFLEPDRTEIDRGPWAFDALAILFLPVAISRIGPAEAPPEAASTGALIGLALIGAALIGGLVYSLRSRSGPDEWVARIWERGCAFAILTALAADMVWSLAAEALLVRPMSANDLLAVQLIALSLSWLWFRWRG